MAERARVAVVDDHPLLAEMLVDHLGRLGVAGVAVDANDPRLAETIHNLGPDLVLLDAVFHNDEDGGIRLLEALVSSDLRVAMLTGVCDEIRHAEFLNAGAVAVILKSSCISDVLFDVRAVLDGVDTHGVTRRAELQDRLAAYRSEMNSRMGVLDSLTNRERATLQSLVDGVPVEEIADERSVASSTVRSQVRAIFRKFDANSQIKAVSIAVRLGMQPSNRAGSA